MPTAGPRWLMLAVALSAVVPYLQTIPDYFMQDDFGVVQLLTTRPWTMFPRWFTMSWMEQIWGATPDEIRPFVAFTYQLTGKFAPHRPELHHIVNIAFHAANAVLVMALARRATGVTPLAAAFAGVIFAVLPSQVESAAWITGRVDGMPTFFYLGTFLAYVVWRERGGMRWYGWSLVLFFVALFSKQNAITVPATIAAYDLLVIDRTRRGSLVACLRAWLPFAALTLGYLALRRIVLGQSVRGGIESWHAVETFLGVVHRHLYRVTTGHTPPATDSEVAAGVVILAATAFAIYLRPAVLRLLLCFSVIWWIVGTAPLVVVGYESLRHIYLAAAAWAFLLAMVVDVLLSRTGRPTIRLALGAVCILLATGYALLLNSALQEWDALARVSKTAVERVGQEAATSPPGTLFLVSVPTKSWEWGIPFVLQPPYQQQDLAARVRVVTPWRLHCCGPHRWREYALRHLREWHSAPTRPPVVALHVSPRTGAVSRATDSDNAELRELIPVLLETDTPEALDGALNDLLERVAARGASSYR